MSAALREDQGLREDLRDAQGTQHHPAETPFRIVSLVPSITELLCDLGLTPHLAGRTGFCIHPAAQVKAIAKIGGTKDVNLAKIRKLAPTHLVVNIDENEKPTVDALREFIPHVIVTHPNAPTDNLALYGLLGGIFGVETAARALQQEFSRARTALLAHAWEPRKVLYLIWKDPWMTVSTDTYIARTLAQVNWLHVVIAEGENPRRYPALTDSQLEDAASTADLILLSTEPYRFDASHVAELAQRFPGKTVRLIDGEMTSWYGSRAIAGLRYLEAFAQST